MHTYTVQVYILSQNIMNNWEALDVGCHQFFLEPDHSLMRKRNTPRPVSEEWRGPWEVHWPFQLDCFCSWHREKLMLLLINFLANQNLSVGLLSQASWCNTTHEGWCIFCCWIIPCCVVFPHPGNYSDNCIMYLLVILKVENVSTPAILPDCSAE